MEQASVLWVVQTFGNDIKAVKELNLWDPPALSQVLFWYVDVVPLVRSDFVLWF